MTMCVRNRQYGDIRSQGAALMHTSDITLLWRSGGPGPCRGLLLKPAVHGAIDRRALRVPQHHDEPRARLLHAVRHSRRHLGRRTVALGPATMSFPLQALRLGGCLALSAHKEGAGLPKKKCVHEGKGMQNS